MAERFEEAVVLGIKAIKVPLDTLYLQSIWVEVKQPVVHRQVTGAVLNAWLAMPGKDENE